MSRRARVKSNRGSSSLGCDRFLEVFRRLLHRHPVAAADDDEPQTGRYSEQQPDRQSGLIAARTTIQNERYNATIEHPIKTINVGRREPFYQTDTGPVMLPDLTRDWDDMIDGIELAYSAFNAADRVEFIVRVPSQTPRGDRVHHYGQSVRWDCTNEIVVLGTD